MSTTHSRAASPHARLTELRLQPPDPILTLIGLLRDDPRPHKIDLGVGVYRDPDGNTPVFAAVKAAERVLTATQTTKSYLGQMGNTGFNHAIAALLLGRELSERSHLAGIQTPGGTGALRLAAELIARAAPSTTVWLGLPSYANHAPIFAAAGLRVRNFNYFDIGSQNIVFDEMLQALTAAASGDVVLLHGSCHNPTGADMTPPQWQQLSALLAERALLPLIDAAYQGLGAGLDEDVAGLRHLVTQVQRSLITYSCSKNFGLYRERTGALFVVTDSNQSADIIASNLASLARVNWSLPPDHGAELVRLILTSAELTGQWQTELRGMRERILTLRAALTNGNPRLASVTRQAGLFSMLALTPQAIETLRRDHGIYMVGSGRINIAGLNIQDVPYFVNAFKQVQGADAALTWTP